MKHNINLFLGLQKKAIKNLPAAFLMRILLVYFAVLMIIWAMTWSLGLYQKTVLSQTLEKQAKADKKWNELQAKYIIQEKMDENTRYWATLLEAKKQRYSRYFRDLAMQTPEGVWLQTIEIGSSGNFIKLEGKTFNSPLAMILLKNLISDSVFKDKKFKIFDLNVTTEAKTNTNQKLASFTVQTE